MIEILQDIGFYRILGGSVFVWLGRLALLFMVLGVMTMVLNKKRIHIFPFKMHMVFGYITFAFAFLHAFFAIIRGL